MINIRKYYLFQSELNTTEISLGINSTVSVPPNGLSNGAIAGIVIGTIVGVVGLVLLAFILYKYRERVVNLLNKDSKQSNDRSIPKKQNNSQPNITYSPEHEYLTVNTLSSSNRNQQFNRKPGNNQPVYENFSQ